MLIHSKFRRPLGLFALAASALALAGSPARADQPSHYLFIGDLNTGTLLRYDADPGPLFGTPYGLDGNTSDPAYIVGYGVTEGVHGTGDTLITSQHLNGVWDIARFNRFTGQFMDLVSPQTFQTVGDIALTPDASTVYVPDGDGKTLYKIDVATGNVLATATFPGVHDVAIGPDGSVYATGFNAGSGIVRFSPDLTDPVTVVANGADGLTRPTGMTFGPDGSLYVVQNTTPNSGSGFPNGSVYKFTLNGSNPATLDAVDTSSDLGFGIGIDYGPNGDLYVAAPGTYNGWSGTDNVAQIDLSGGPLSSSSPVSSFLTYTGTDSSTTYTSTASSVVWPKYLKFDTNFAPADDPGVSVPEGSTVMLASCGLLIALPLLRRGRRSVR